MRILIVDDNASLRKVLAAFFSALGHEVVGALPDGSGIEAAVAELRPELVCLDYNLPGRDGLTLLGCLHALAPQLDVLFMTASSEPGIDARAADAGAAGFIRKPFNQAQIAEELQAVARTRRLAQKAAAAPAVRVRNYTAVVADDSFSVRLVLNGVLDECGVKVVASVANGAEAVNAASKLKPTLLCLDVNMPVLGGIDALPRILEASPETAVVMVTGAADPKFVAQAAGLGARGYILKPIRPAYVENFLRKLLG